jgi:hypothetical protein
MSQLSAWLSGSDSAPRGVFTDTISSSRQSVMFDPLSLFAKDQRLDFASSQTHENSSDPSDPMTDRQVGKLQNDLGTGMALATYRAHHATCVRRRRDALPGGMCHSSSRGRARIVRHIAQHQD